MPLFMILDNAFNEIREVMKMGMTTDDMIEQLRRRKIPYDNELNDSIDYAISCIKARDQLESIARKYRKLQKEHKV